MNRDPRRLAAVGLALVLLVAVVVAVAFSAKDKLASPTVALHGLIGSEKLGFFHDPRVVAALKRGGFDVTVNTAGSRDIASRDLKGQDFAFPAGAPSGEKVRKDHAGAVAQVPFFTPMAIATWKPIVALLEAAGVAHDSGQYVSLDMAAYMALVAKDTRWKDLPGNTAYPVNKSLLITSTDVRTSNSAAMYLSLASYVANGNNIVQTNSGLDQLVDGLAPIFLRQGFVAASSDAPFQDYLVQGMGKSPMVMIYKSQFVERAASGDGSVTPDMVLMYPDPTIFSKHTYVSLSPDGARLGDFITTDPEMRTLATQFGFRTSDAAGFRSFVAAHQLAVPDSFLNVIDPPTYETLEAMIKRLEQSYAGNGMPPAATDAPSALSSPGANP